MLSLSLDCNYGITTFIRIDLPSSSSVGRGRLFCLIPTVRYKLGSVRSSTIRASLFLLWHLSKSLTLLANAGGKWERRYSSYSFLIALHGGEWSASRPDKYFASAGESNPCRPVSKQTLDIWRWREVQFSSLPDLITAGLINEICINYINYALMWLSSGKLRLVVSEVNTSELSVNLYEVIRRNHTEVFVKLAAVRTRTLISNACVTDMYFLIPLELIWPKLWLFLRVITNALGWCPTCVMKFMLVTLQVVMNVYITLAGKYFVL
jgi:hypothetical protein